MNYDKVLTEEIKDMIKKDYIENFFSIRDIAKKYNIKSKEYLCNKLLKGHVRNYSEASKIAHRRYPDNFRHDEVSKEKMREARLKFLHEHPEKTAWRQSNLSYPEKMFKNMLIEEHLDEKYLIIREYCIFPYYIDFAFVDIKVAVEIDGSQHMEEERHKRDMKKDELLISNGWRVLRFTASDVLNKRQYVINTLMQFLNSNVSFEKVGILKAKSGYSKVKRNSDGFTESMISAYEKMRKVPNRPLKEELWEMVINYPFTKIAERYNVSDKTIVKWCKKYKLPSSRKAINNFIKENNKVIS